MNLWWPFNIAEIQNCVSSGTLILDLHIIASVQYKYLHSVLQSPVSLTWKQETHGNNDLQDAVWNKEECFFLMWSNWKGSGFPIYTFFACNVRIVMEIWMFIFNLYSVVHITSAEINKYRNENTSLCHIYELYGLSFILGL